MLQGSDGGVLLYVGVGSVAAGVVALSVGFAISGGQGPAGPQAARVDVSTSTTIRPKSSDLETLFGPRAPAAAGMRLASLETATGLAVENRRSAPSASAPAASLQPRLPFDQRFVFGVSFDDRFAAANGTAVAARRPPIQAIDTETHTVIASLAPQVVREPTPARPAAAQATRVIVRAISPAQASPPAGVPDKQLAYAAPESIPDADTENRAADAHTAIYDIVAHTVYLPNGQKLEAHSGLGERMDDPRHITAKGQGPTPPNVYKLTLRERSFHGVRAIRLIPADESKMFGRDGMLAHTYMLGPNGQSNGCVSFNDYQAFLTAFQNGEIDRLVVVEHLASEPGPKTASGSWLPQAIRDLFGRS